MKNTKTIIKEKKEEVTISITCDYCGKEKHKGKYASIGVSNGHWHDSGWESYQFCDNKCLGEYIKQMEDIDLVFTIDEYTLRSD